MADTDPVIRLHYFDHQFLREEDFTAEQAYHIRMRRLHNRVSHTPGIATGLLLSAVVGSSSVTIAPGIAVDNLGQELVQVASGAVDIGTLANKTAFITIAYGEQQTNPTSETGVTDSTRWTETPVIEASDTAPSNPTLKLILGQVKIDAGGKVAALPDNGAATGRLSAGVVAGDLNANSAKLTSGLQVGTDILVTGRVDGRDISADGTKLDGHVANTTNPHATTPAQIGALPANAGLARNVVGGNKALIVTTQSTPIGSPTTIEAALNAVSGVEGVVGLFVRSPSANPPAPPAPASTTLALRVDGLVAINGALTTGPLTVNGAISATGGKGGYVVDTFVNASGKRLHTGDVVRLKGTPVVRFYGDNNKIPVTEVTLADTANDSRVIGIVDREAFPSSDSPDTRQKPDDPTFVADGGDVLVVTLGAYAHCKVDAGAAPIAVGDLLTSSATSGCAQKATDPKLGTIIGKALEPLNEGTGYIAVFVNIQ